MITVEVPRWLLWAGVAVVWAGLGAVGGALAYRHGPYAQLEGRWKEALEVAAARERELAEARRQLEATASRLGAVQQELERKGQELAATRERLQHSERQRQVAAQEAARQRNIVLSRERDIYILRTCLAGVAESLVGVLEERYEDAAYALRAVERECRAASRLVQ